MKSLALQTVVATAGLLLAFTQAHAIVVTPSTNGTTLANALLAGGGTGISVTNVTLNAHTDEALLLDGSATVYSSGTYTNASGTYSIGPGVLLSTGAVNAVPDSLNGDIPGYGDGPWPNNVDTGIPGFPGAGTTWGYDVMATAGQEALLDPITRNSSCAPAPDFCNHFDVTELVINFDMQPGFTEVRFNIVFGSEEWPEFRDSQFIDGFGMFLNGTNIAFVGGQPVNIQHPDTKPVVTGLVPILTGTEPDAITGTALDGILGPNGNPVLTFSGPVNLTGNQLRFIVGDTSDSALDTTVYFSALTGVPAPPAVWLLGTGLAALIVRRTRSRRVQ